MTAPDRNLDDLLRAANPIAEDQLPLPSESPTAQLLYEKITGTPYAGSPVVAASRVRRRRWLGPGVAALLALAGGGAAGAYAVATRLHTHLAVSCYAGPSLQSTVLAVAAGPEGPVTACARAWDKGSVGPGPTPLLVACLTPQGVAAVFPSAPGADICGQLRLPPLPAGAASLDTTTTAASAPTTATPGTLPPDLRDAVVANLRATCLPAAEAELTITKLLAKAGVAWTVVTPTPFPNGHPCASPGFDEGNHRVVLSGVPPPSP